QPADDMVGELVIVLQQERAALREQGAKGRERVSLPPGFITHPPLHTTKAGTLNANGSITTAPIGCRRRWSQPRPRATGPAAGGVPDALRGARAAPPGDRRRATGRGRPRRRRGSFH